MVSYMKSEKIGHYPAPKGRKRDTIHEYNIFLPESDYDEMGLASATQARRFYIENSDKGDEPGVITVIEGKGDNIREEYVGEIGFSRKGGYYFTDGYLVWGVARDGRLIASSMRKARK